MREMGTRREQSREKELVHRERDMDKGQGICQSHLHVRIYWGYNLHDGAFNTRRGPPSVVSGASLGMNDHLMSPAIRGAEGYPPLEFIGILA